MARDPISAALRADADLLGGLAPAPNAAATWHAIRAARARKLRQTMSLCGWALRGSLVLVLVGLGWLWPNAIAGAALPLLLIGWLTFGLCGPLRGRGPLDRAAI